MEYSIEDFCKVRGFQQVTQGDALLQEEVIKETRRSRGNKISSLAKIRTRLIDNNFAEDELFELISLATSKCDIRLEMIPDDTRELLARALMEKIIRDFVPLQSVKEILKCIELLYVKSQKNTEHTFEKIHNFASTGAKFAECYRMALRTLEDWGEETSYDNKEEYVEFKFVN